MPRIVLTSAQSPNQQTIILKRRYPYPAEPGSGCGAHDAPPGRPTYIASLWSRKVCVYPHPSELLSIKLTQLSPSPAVVFTVRLQDGRVHVLGEVRVGDEPELHDGVRQA